MGREASHLRPAWRCDVNKDICNVGDEGRSADASERETAIGANGMELASSGKGCCSVLLKTAQGGFRLRPGGQNQHGGEQQQREEFQRGDALIPAPYPSPREGSAAVCQSVGSMYYFRLDSQRPMFDCSLDLS